MNIFNKIFKRNEKLVEPKSEGKFSFSSAIEHYKRIGVNIASGASNNEIEEVQNKLDFKFPDDFKEFHSMCNGFLEWDMDNNHFSIWTFDRIIEEYEKEKKQDYDFIPISDYLINSHWFGYIRNEEGIFKDFDRKVAVAKNFENFLKLLLSDSEKLY